MLVRTFPMAAGVFISLYGAAVAQQPAESLKAGEVSKPSEPMKRFLKEKLPAIGKGAQYEDNKSFPPKLKGVTPIPSKLKVKALPDLLPPETVERTRVQALSDSRVKQVLGSRFVFLDAAVQEPVKGKEEASQKSPTFKLLFYNYDKNTAHMVLVGQGRVLKVALLPARYQPAETRDEVRDAESIVRSDSRYAAAVAGLRARGIFTPVGVPDRHILVLFRKPGEERNSFTALVNMSKRKVVRAGPRKTR